MARRIEDYRLKIEAESHLDVSQDDMVKACGPYEDATMFQRAQRKSSMASNAIKMALERVLSYSAEEFWRTVKLNREQVERKKRQRS